MGEVASRFLQTIRLERQAFVWMDFNDRATGDALVLVAITQVLMFAGFAGGLGSVFNIGLWDLLIGLILSGLVQWLLYSAIACFLIFLLLLALGRKMKASPGSRFFLGACLYAGSRLVVDSFRDDLRRHPPWDLASTQWVGIAVLLSLRH